MDRNEALAKQVEQCPWCGGKVRVARATEPGEITLISCIGPLDGDPCAWAISGEEAEHALRAASQHAA